jgi:hypothetical protein
MDSTRSSHAEYQGRKCVRWAWDINGSDPDERRAMYDEGCMMQREYSDFFQQRGLSCRELVKWKLGYDV